MSTVPGEHLDSLYFLIAVLSKNFVLDMGAVLFYGSKNNSDTITWWLSPNIFALGGKMEINFICLIFALLTQNYLLIDLIKHSGFDGSFDVF